MLYEMLNYSLLVLVSNLLILKQIPKIIVQGRVFNVLVKEF